jgi:hypothetical protein
MALALYTVTVNFADRTVAIEQVSADGPEAALEYAFRQSEALAKYPREAIELMRLRYIHLNHLANFRGVWIWHQIPNECRETEDIYAGLVVQSDSAAPSRGQLPLRS